MILDNKPTPILIKGLTFNLIHIPGISTNTLSTKSINYDYLVLQM